MLVFVNIQELKIDILYVIPPDLGWWMVKDLVVVLVEDLVQELVEDLGILKPGRRFG